MKMTALRAAVLGALALGQSQQLAWSADNATSATSADKGLGQVVVTGAGERQQYRQSPAVGAGGRRRPA